MDPPRSLWVAISSVNRCAHHGMSPLATATGPTDSISTHRGLVTSVTDDLITVYPSRSSGLRSMFLSRDNNSGRNIMKKNRGVSLGGSRRRSALVVAVVISVMTLAAPASAASKKVDHAVDQTTSWTVETVSYLTSFGRSWS